MPASAHKLWKLLVSELKQLLTLEEKSTVLFANDHHLLLCFAVKACKIFFTKEMLLLSFFIGYSGEGEEDVFRCFLTVKLNYM